MALGTRLRAMSARVTEEAEGIYRLYGVDIDPRWFPVFYVLDNLEIRSITEIARYIGQTHGAVSQVAKAMEKAGFIEFVPSLSDKRVRELALSAKGQKQAQRLKAQIEDVGAAISEMKIECGESLWNALAVTEAALNNKTLVERVQLHRKKRIQSKIIIRHFRDEDVSAFAQLNLSWIERYFVVEDRDREALLNPQASFLNHGGCILVAELESEVIGVIAMGRHGEDSVELAKMAVKDEVQGFGVGLKLCEAFFEEAKSRGYKNVFLESNTRLEPAIHLYRRVGFVEYDGPPSDYERCDIQMVKSLT